MREHHIHDVLRRRLGELLLLDELLRRRWLGQGGELDPLDCRALWHTRGRDALCLLDLADDTGVELVIRIALASGRLVDRDGDEHRVRGVEQREHRLLEEETGLPVIVADDPLTCVARGGGTALEMMDTKGHDLITNI